MPLTRASRAATLDPQRRDNHTVIRLDCNENACGPSPKVIDAIRNACGRSNRYPRLEYGALSERISAYHRVKPEQIVLGCGSTEIFRMAALVFLAGGKQLVQASPTHEAMAYYARTIGSNVIAVNLTPTFAHDLDGMLARVGPSTALIYVCNPNNPTGTLTPRKNMETFISKLPASSYVVIDEAYHDYAGISAMYASFIDRPIDDDRVIVTRTFSKVYGLAGLRVGYAVCSTRTAQQMRKFATEDGINAIATQAALASLEDTDARNEAVSRNANDRQEFFNQAMARALKPIESRANFVMMNTFHPADEVAHYFSSNNILIGYGFPGMDTHIRVSLGLPEEMKEFWQTWDTLPYPKNVMHH